MLRAAIEGFGVKNAGRINNDQYGEISCAEFTASRLAQKRNASINTTKSYIATDPRSWNNIHV